MSRPDVLEGALVALGAAVAGSSLHTGLGLVLPAADALSLTLSALGLGYLLYLLARGRDPAGRVLLVLAWLAATGSALAVVPHPWGQVPTQLGLAWIARVWRFQRTPGAALLDLGLILAGALVALWAAVHTGSLFLALWSLFLVQGLFGAIPVWPGQVPAGGRAGVRAVGRAARGEPFELACRAAQVALGRLERGPRGPGGGPPA